jgi:transposase-like protein
MDDHEAGKEQPGAAERPQESGAAAPGRGGRMSRPRKTASVLRLLRGEDLETVSRSLGVTAATLTTWRDAFLAAGEAALASRPTDGETFESERLKARLGEMLLKHELLEQKITSLEAGRPLARQRWKR